MIRITSILSFRKLKEKDIRSHKKMILDLLDIKYPLSNRRIGKILNIPINIVTARVNELSKETKIYSYQTELDKETNRKVMVWTLHPCYILQKVLLKENKNYGK